MKFLVVILVVAAVVLLCTGHVILACGAIMLAGTMSRFIIRTQPFEGVSMSSSLNHYTANVQVTDAVMHNKTPLATSTFVIAVLAANVTDAQALIQEFYGRSGCPPR